MAMMTNDIADQAVLKLKPVVNAAPYNGQARSGEPDSKPLHRSNILIATPKLLIVPLTRRHASG